MRLLASVGVGVALVLGIAVVPRAQGPSPPAQPAIDFVTEIHPILQARCLGCHGETLKLSKLDLRTREAAIDGGAHGPSLVPGQAEQSRLYRHVVGLETPIMPMRGEPLTPVEVAAIKRWIDEGAVWPTVAAAASSVPALAAFEDRPLTQEERSYWAFQLPVQAPVPVVGTPRFTHPIDRFLEAARQARGLTAAPRADRRTLVRRAYLDLLGLPPSPDEVARFVADDRPDAWDSIPSGRRTTTPCRRRSSAMSRRRCRSRRSPRPMRTWPGTRRWTGDATRCARRWRRSRSPIAIESSWP